jgi:hypothetical protein
MSTSNTPVRLGPAEMVAGRPFTNLDHNDEDLAILRYMRQELCRGLSQAASVPERPLVLQFLEDGVRHHRIVISQLEGLLSCCEITWVGFCGQKRAGADSTLLDGIDVELINEFPQYPDVLSYSSLELANGDWRNLILMSCPAGIEHWRTSVRHAYAAHVLSPDYYENVRLHSGVLAGRLLSDSDLVIRRTKYYDFRGGKLWLAVREF